MVAAPEVNRASAWCPRGSQAEERRGSQHALGWEVAVEVEAVVEVAVGGAGSRAQGWVRCCCLARREVAAWETAAAAL